MARQGVRLVYGGGRVGLMGLLADAIMAGGGEVVGIIPQHLDKAEISHQSITELHVVKNMHVRKEMMFRLADAVAVLPGGLGTLDETFEMITWRQLGLHDKPILIVDIKGFWRPLLDLVDHVCEAGFASPKARELVATVASVDQILPKIRALPEPKVAPFLDRI